MSSQSGSREMVSEYERRKVEDEMRLGMIVVNM